MAVLNAYLALGNMDASGAVFTEMPTTVGGYVRQPIALQPTGGGSVRNSGAVQFLNSSQYTWPSFRAYAVFDALTDGAPMMAWDVRTLHSIRATRRHIVAAGAIDLKFPRVESNHGTEVVTAGPYAVSPDRIFTPPRLLNPLRDVWQQDTMLAFRAKINKLRAGKATRNVRFAIHGSSVPRGVDETTGSVGSAGYKEQYPRSISYWLAKFLAAGGIPSGANNLFGVGGPSPTDLANRDSRIVFPGTLPGTGSMSVPGGLTMTFAAGVSMAITMLDSVNQFDVYAMDYHTAGINYDANIDGGANTNIATTGVDQYRNVVSLTAGAVGAHTLNLVFGASNGGGWLAGVDAYDNTRKEVSIWNHACAGFTSSSVVSQNGTPQGGRLTFYDKFPIDAGGGEMGLPNSWRFNIGPTQTYNDLVTFIQKMFAIGAVPYFITPPYDGSGTGDAANQEQYVQAMIQAGGDYRIPVIGHRESTVSYAASFAAGLQGDAIHWTTYNGAVDAARMTKAVFFPD